MKNQPHKRKEPLGRTLVRAGVITPKQLKFALNIQRKQPAEHKEMLGEILLRTGLVDEPTLVKHLERFYGISYCPLRKHEGVDISVLKLVPERTARYFKLVPLGLNKERSKIVVVMSNPFNILAVDTIAAFTGYKVEKYFASDKEIEDAIDRFYAEQSMKSSMSNFIKLKDAEEVEEEKENEPVIIEAEAAPVINFVDSMLKNAVKNRASDVHVEPCADKLRIRYRIDGILQEVEPPSKRMQSAVLTRLKLLADINIAEQRLPQDGRFITNVGGRDIDIRVATTPTVHGEKLVLRILDKSGLLVNMEELGMSDKEVVGFKSILKQPYGFVLVTGPTGSGKTTTLYSALNFVNTPDKNIITIEDPIEYQLYGVNQIQTKAQIGLTFSSGLRAVLRQDPNIIMIGEIRDLETVENAVKASLTGHLVLSTIHTNDAPSVITRLKHMGLEFYLISSCLNLVIAQRLARRLCDDCKEKLTISADMLKKFANMPKMDLSGVSFYQAKGCEKCNNTGYKGRTGLYEFLLVSKKIKDAINEEAGEDKIREIARQEGMKTIFEHGIEKAKLGITSLEEVLRVTVLEKAY